MTPIDTAKDTTRRHKEQVKTLVEKIVASPNNTYEQVFADADSDIQASLAKIIDRTTGVFNADYFSRVRARDYVFKQGDVPMTYAILRLGDNLINVRTDLKQQGITELGLGIPGDLIAIVPSCQDSPLRAITQYPIAIATMDPPARASTLHEKAIRELVLRCGERSCGIYLMALPAYSRCSKNEIVTVPPDSY